MIKTIRIKGARHHNLKNIDLDIPKEQFVVFTGVSGSGKSSLAFDTIYAEGQRRYVESLSAYARQFLGIMDKPDVDFIEGLSPSISIDQKTVTHNPRSTVGTITEVYDYLRVLFARIGTPHCPRDGSVISRLSTDQIVDTVFEHIKLRVSTNKLAPHAFSIVSPIVKEKKGEFQGLFENLRQKGFREVRVDGRVFLLEDDIPLLKSNKHSISVVVDSFSLSFKDLKAAYIQDTLTPRLAQSIETATTLSEGLVILEYFEDPAHVEIEAKTGKQAETIRQVIYSQKLACPACGFSLSELEPRMFSFNSPIGACEECRGLGTIHKADSDSIFAPKLSINEGGVLPFTKFYFAETWYMRLLKAFCEEEGISLLKPIETFSPAKRELLLHGTPKTYKVTGENRFGKTVTITEKFDGLLAEIERKYYGTTTDDGSHELGRYMQEVVCSKCHGNKLKPEVLAVTIQDLNIAQLCDLAVSDIIDYASELPTLLNDYEKQVAKPVLKEIISRLQFLMNVGLGYLTLSRKGKTLSGGELQRIRLASQIGTGLAGVLYVLDEPSIGLHSRDVTALIKTLKHLRDIGNTLIVVEHDEETIRAADHILELGPGAGKSGGNVVYNGDAMDITEGDSLTGAYLSGKRKVEIEVPAVKPSGTITLKKASEFNLKSVDLTVPLGALIVVTGVSGSGKSTLITETLYPALKYHLEGHYTGFQGAYERLEGFHDISRVYLVDQSPIGRTPRSNPATYIGFFDSIRDLFSQTQDARTRGYDKGRFSFNVKGGRCEKCQGAGVVKIEMQFLSDVYIVCDVCNGKRYNRETLEVRFKEKSIYDILSMTIDDAAHFFESFHQIQPKLSFLQEVGLGYITLGQPAPTFSGGEAQRIKLANELSRGQGGRTLYILDEPTTGLHFADVQKLLSALKRLVDQGNTVLVIEHNMDVIKHAQYVVDMGPEGGDGGGSILYQGETRGILQVKSSYTAKYLKHYLANS